MKTLLRRDPDGSTWWEGKRMTWFDGDAMHVDAIVYARARGIPLRDAEKEIVQFTREALGNVKIHHVID